MGLNFAVDRYKISNYLKKKVGLFHWELFKRKVNFVFSNSENNLILCGNGNNLVLILILSGSCLVWDGRM